MYDQIRENTIFIILYAVVTAMTMIASCYLLFRQGNAFARDVTPPLRLRRWTAAYFAAAALCHLWYMPIFFLTSSEDIMMTDLVGGLLDSMTVFPLVIIVMLNMLQDRRRPLWPIALMIAPFVVGGIFSVATLSYDLIPMLYVYLLLLSVGIVIYMVRATRQYGRWLRDNYADLEHKEVWQSFVVLAVVVLMFGYYVSGDSGMAYEYAIQICGLLLIGFLLWRVESLQDLTIAQPVVSEEIAGPVPDDIERLLRERCEATQLYLQRDLTVSQLAQGLGINRFYLSQYFSRKDTTYNTYINELRIAHFERLYREAVSAQRPVSAKQLAARSGYRSYSTFSLAFKQRTGLSVTAWMNAEGG